MKREVRVTAQADLDLDRLVDFLIDANPSAARKAAAVIRKAIVSLEALAERGRPIPGGLRELVVRFGRRAYVIQYLVEPAVVVGARVFHSLEDRSAP